MIFPYWEIRFDSEIHWLPLVPITVHGQDATVEVLALVDSGSEFSVLGLGLADRLGISLADSTPATLVGIGEHEVPGDMVPVTFQFGKHKWTAPGNREMDICRRHLYTADVPSVYVRSDFPLASRIPPQ